MSTPARGRRTLIATSRSSRVSRALYTSPVPPAPRGAVIRYGPRRVPIAGATGRRNHIGKRPPRRPLPRLVVLFVHAAPEHPAAERTEPVEHVIHVAEVRDFSQVPVEILDEEQPMAARRLLGRTDDLHPLRHEIV